MEYQQEVLALCSCTTDSVTKADILTCQLVNTHRKGNLEETPDDEVRALVESKVRKLRNNCEQIFPLYVYTTAHKVRIPAKYV